MWCENKGAVLEQPYFVIEVCAPGRADRKVLSEVPGRDETGACVLTGACVMEVGRTRTALGLFIAKRINPTGDRVFMMKVPDEDLPKTLDFFGYPELIPQGQS